MDPAINAQLEQSAAQAFSKPVNLKGAKTAEAAREAAVDFEAMFLTQMVEQMFKGLKTDGPFGGGNGEKIYRSMMAQEYGKTMAESGGIGIADMVQKEILKLQEEANQ